MTGTGHLAWIRGPCQVGADPGLFDDGIAFLTGDDGFHIRLFVPRNHSELRRRGSQLLVVAAAEDDSQGAPVVDALAENLDPLRRALTADRADPLVDFTENSFVR